MRAYLTGLLVTRSTVLVNGPTMSTDTDHADDIRSSIDLLGLQHLRAQLFAGFRSSDRGPGHPLFLRRPTRCSSRVQRPYDRGLLVVGVGNRGKNSILLSKGDEPFLDSRAKGPSPSQEGACWWGYYTAESDHGGFAGQRDLGLVMWWSGRLGMPC